MGNKQTLINRMRYWCDEANLGYDQGNRWDIRPGGECDCSSLVYWCLWEAGYGSKPANPWNHTLYTGTLQKDLLNMGFTKLPNNGNPQPGDILLNDTKHVAVCTAPGMISYASIDERGRASGGASGDQTGTETRTRSYYNYPWNNYYRPPADGGSAPAPSTPSNKSVTEVAKEVMDGKWGNGDDRKNRLTAAGYNYSEVQAEVNRLSGSGSSSNSPSVFQGGGKYTVQVNDLQIRTGAGTGYSSVGHYNKGQTVVLDDWSTTNNSFVWGRYKAYSGNIRYIAIGSTDGSKVYLRK